MQLVQHKPAARGVSQLMYVGDADTGPPPLSTGVKIAIIVGIVIGALALLAWGLSHTDEW